MQPSTDQQMRFELCPQCSVTFAMPMELYLRKLGNSGSIHCPSGHTIKLSIDHAGVKASVIQTCERLQATVKELQHELQQTKAILATVPHTQHGAISTEELKRRCEMLAARAEHAEYGKAICRFCGKPQAANYKLRDHLRRCHSVDVAELPAVEFAST